MLSIGSSQRSSRGGLDGLIVTGANLEETPFEQVHYWKELQEVLDWAHKSVASTFYSCWGAHAALKHFYDIDRENYIDAAGKPRKITGVFGHALSSHLVSPFTLGLPDEVLCPHSRWKGIPRAAIQRPELEIVLESPEAGILLMTGRKGREVYVQGHPEYASDALRKEYLRDAEKGHAAVPQGYFPGEDIQAEPKNQWRGTGTILFHNWINFVYQTTHYDLHRPVME